MPGEGPWDPIGFSKLHENIQGPSPGIGSPAWTPPDMPLSDAAASVKVHAVRLDERAREREHRDAA